MRNRIVLFGVAVAMTAAVCTVARAASFPDPPKINVPAAGTATAVLAGGCYWGMQGIFEHMKGVTNTVVGFAGGKKDTARYEIVEDGFCCCTWFSTLLLYRAGAVRLHFGSKAGSRATWLGWERNIGILGLSCFRCGLLSLPALTS